ncbi:MAG TPA: hypothetical protein VF846_07385 [Thermoanaerobaculia bacterium]
MKRTVMVTRAAANPAELLTNGRARFAATHVHGSEELAGRVLSTRRPL